MVRTTMKKTSTRGRSASAMKVKRSKSTTQKTRSRSRPEPKSPSATTVATTAASSSQKPRTRKRVGEEYPMFLDGQAAGGRPAEKTMKICSAKAEGATKRTVGGKDKKLHIGVVEKHDDAFRFIHMGLKRNWISKPKVDSKLAKEANKAWLHMVHFDSHPDLGGINEIHAKEYENANVTGLIADLMSWGATSKAHDDDLGPRLQQLYEKITNADGGIASWILPLVYQQCIGKVTWLKQPWCKQINAGEYHGSYIGQHPKTGGLGSNLGLSYFEGDDFHVENWRKLKNPQPWTLDVIELPETDWDKKNLPNKYHQQQPKDPWTNPPGKHIPTLVNPDNETWILDVDLDYFTTRNPETGELPEHLMHAVCDAVIEYENNEDGGEWGFDWDYFGVLLKELIEEKIMKKKRRGDDEPIYSEIKNMMLSTQDYYIGLPESDSEDEEEDKKKKKGKKSEESEDSGSESDDDPDDNDERPENKPVGDWFEVIETSLLRKYNKKHAGDAKKMEARVAADPEKFKYRIALRDLFQYSSPKSNPVARKEYEKRRKAGPFGKSERYEVSSEMIYFIQEAKSYLTVPEHVANSYEEIQNELGKFERYLIERKKKHGLPEMVTIARSCEGGFLPARWSCYVERDVIEIIARVFGQAQGGKLDPKNGEFSEKVQIQTHYADELEWVEGGGD